MNRSAADDYIRKVARSLSPALGDERDRILLELKNSIEDRVLEGQDLPAVLEQLGDPEALAASYAGGANLRPASFLARAAARVADFFVVALIVLPLAIAGGTSLPAELAGLVVVGAIVAGAISFGVYLVAAEAFFGTTAGKKAFGLYVVRESGGAISLGQAVVRHLPLFFQFYWIDVLFALFTERRQRAVELLSKTRVVAARH